jgi:copper chaperone
LRSALVFLLMLTTALIAAEQKATINIEGMTCNGCVMSVTNALQKLDGVKAADVRLKPGDATVTYDDAQVKPAAMMDAIAALGYKASMPGMTVGEATHCETEAKQAAQAKPDPVEAARAKPAVVKGGCPMASTCKEAGTKDKCAPSASATNAQPMVKPAAMAEEAHTCVTLTQCKELNEFHEAMHPLHEALGNGDYAAVRAGYPELAAKAKALEAMKCDKSCVKDVATFDKYRQNLIASVENLGKACQRDDNKKLTAAFDKMHEAYNELGQQAK